jgi:hypothetical protein
MATIEELKEMVVDLKVSLALSQIRDNCPYAYNYIHRDEDEKDDCNSISCSACKRDFENRYTETVRKELDEM